MHKKETIKISTLVIYNMNKKHIIIVTLILFCGAFAIADEDNEPETLFGDVLSFSGYGGVSVEYARLGNENNGWLTGGRGGVIINDRYVFGGAGKMLVHPTRRGDLTDTEYTGEEPYVHLGYGGILLEHYLNPKDLFHVSIGVIGGAGGIAYSEFSIDDDDVEYDEESEHGVTNFDAFFVVEPEVNVFVNITRFCRIGAGISYRYTYGVDGDRSASELSDDILTGFNGLCQIQFGWF